MIINIDDNTIIKSLDKFTNIIKIEIKIYQKNNL